MKLKKKKSIITIIIIALLIILFCSFVFAFVFTDTFKSNKSLFFKYIVQNSEILDFFKDSDIENYRNRQNIVAYSNKGTIKADISSLTSNPDIENSIKNCSINFEGNVDKQHKYIYENIKANYSNTQNLSFELVKNDDIYAINLNDVVDKYFGIENKDLKDFAKKMGANEEFIELIPNKIEFAEPNIDINFSNDEINQIKEKYLNIILNNLKDEMFEKEQKDGNNIYILTITTEQIEEIGKELYTIFKDDEFIWNKIKEFMKNKLGISEEQTNEYINNAKKVIQELLENKQLLKMNNISTEANLDYNEEIDLNSITDDVVDNQETNSLNTNMEGIEFEEITPQTENSDKPNNTEEKNEIKLKIYVKDNSLTKSEIVISSKEGKSARLSLIKNNIGYRIEFSIGDETYSANISKIKDGNDLKYELNAAKGTDELFSLKISISGLNTDEINEKAQMKFGYNMDPSVTTKTKFNYEYNNIKTFGTETEKVDTSQNIVIFNTASNATSAVHLLTRIKTKLEQVNTDKMNASGILNSQTNPFEYYIPIAIPITATISISEPKIITSMIPNIATIGTGVYLQISTNKKENSVQETQTNINDIERNKITNWCTNLKLILQTQEPNNPDESKTNTLTKKLIETELKKNNIEATVVENKDKSFTITILGTKNKYNIDKTGNLISYEYVNK